MEWGYDVHLLRTADGHELTTPAVVLAMGVAYRRLEIPIAQRLAAFASSSARHRPRRSSTSIAASTWSVLATPSARPLSTSPSGPGA